MVNYTSLIALSYFKQYGEKYMLSELIEILGMTSNKFDILLQELFDKKLIEYHNNLIRITDSGRVKLVANNMYHYNNNDQDYFVLYAKKDRVWPIDRPYIPRIFSGR